MKFLAISFARRFHIEQVPLNVLARFLYIRMQLKQKAIAEICVDKNHDKLL